ncbi:ABC transporter substrate-binding protein [Cupriavidus necator]|uniref:ABC transporter substrate-binding protein n=1 Tax=Cupriavidus necator TaxID=106590 RepID=UPI003ECD8650
MLLLRRNVARPLRAATAAILLPFALHATASTTKVSDGVVKIAVLTDMSGIFSELGGRGSVIATKMAIDDFIAEAKPSFNIEMVYADHQNKPDVGANKVRQWYDTQQVDMVVDAINSAVAISASNVTREKNRLLIVTGAGSMRLTNEDCSRNTISYTWDTYSTSRPQTVAITKNGDRNWYFVTVDYALGHSIEQDGAAAVKSAGGNVLGSARHPINTPDFSSFMLQAQASKAQAIGIASAGSDLVNAVKAAQEFGLTKNQTVVPLSGSITDVHALGLQVANGMVLTEGFYWDLDDKTRSWSQRFFDRHKRMPNLIHAGTYSAVLTYLKAVQATGTDAALDVRKKLGQMSINDVFARNGRIREDGRMVHDMYLVQVKKPSESKRPWDYFHVKSVIPGDKAFQPLDETRCGHVKRPG